MSIAKRRIAKGWTQEQLADVSGLSARTVQRIESGNSANLESLKCLASVFETNVADLIKEQDMQNQAADHSDLDANTDANSYLETEDIKYVKNLKEFYRHLIVFIIVAPCLVAFNAWLTPGIWWVVWAIGPWGFAIAMHCLSVLGLLNLLGPKWEQQQFRKRMQKHHRNQSN